jgi:hypothetical protein
MTRDTLSGLQFSLVGYNIWAKPDFCPGAPVRIFRSFGSCFVKLSDLQTLFFQYCPVTCSFDLLQIRNRDIDVSLI